MSSLFIGFIIRWEKRKKLTGADLIWDDSRQYVFKPFDPQQEPNYAYPPFIPRTMSDQPAAVLARTPLAVTETYQRKYGQFTVWFKVYFQDSHGHIRTVSGGGGGDASVVCNASLGKEFAAISWGAPDSCIRPEVSTRLSRGNWQG